MAGGRAAEFESFAAGDGGRLLGFAFLLTGNRHDAEDLVQEALLRSARRWSAARQHPASYTRAVLLNLVKDRWRAQKRHAEVLAGELSRLEPAVDDMTTTVSNRQSLVYACRLLPVQQRAVLVLRFWEDLSVDETAAILRCTPGTVKSQTHRALARLREVLGVLPTVTATPDWEQAAC